MNDGSGRQPGSAAARGRAREWSPHDQEWARLQATALETAANAVLITDVKGTILWVNPAFTALTGYAADEVIGRNPRLLKSGRHDQGFYRNLWKTILSGRTWRGEFMNRRKDGALCHDEHTITPVRREGGAITHFVGIMQDITERRRAEDALRARDIAEAANRLKDEFLANMSHELRTPLNGIIGFSEFLHDEKPGKLNPKQKEYLGDILNSGRHLLQLINDVLDLAKVEADRMELNLEEFNARKEIDEVRAVLEAIASRKRIVISVDVPPEIGAVTLDPHRFKQVFYNLISNAIKFTGEDGRVEVTAGVLDANFVEYSVRDNGIGIRPEDQPRIFHKFEQLDAGAARRCEGTGLGLVLTKKLVEMQGGSIRFESEYDKGSTFTVTLPRVARDEKAGNAGSNGPKTSQ